MTRLTAAPTGFGIGVCALFCAVLPVTAQDNNAGGTLATFSFGQSFVYSDEPSQRSSVTEEFSARTDLGFNLNSRTQRSDIDLDLSTALQSGVGDSQDFDFVDPEARLRYNITSRNSRLGLRATYAEADVNALDDDLDVTDQDLTFGQGKRQTTGYFLNFDTGLEAPFGLGLRASRIERRFSDTTDPDLIDTLNETYSIEGRFRISPVMQMTAGLEQSFYEGDDALETDRETRTTSLGVNYQLRPDLTADASLFYTQNDNTTLTGTESNDGLGFSVDLRLPNTTLVGYRAKPHTGVIDLDNINHYTASEYWEEVHSDNGKIILDPGAFYILVSREAVTIPPDYAAEMAPFLAMVGEFRVHYAGFFDPGFGYAEAGGAGSRGVLEVRCHEAPFVLEHGQVVGRLIYEKMAAQPEQLYGADLASNYQGQGLKLSKHFKNPG